MARDRALVPSTVQGQAPRPNPDPTTPPSDVHVVASGGKFFTVLAISELCLQHGVEFGGIDLARRPDGCGPNWLRNAWQAIARRAMSRLQEVNPPGLPFPAGRNQPRTGTNRAGGSGGTPSTSSGRGPSGGDQGGSKRLRTPGSAGANKRVREGNGGSPGRPTTEAARGQPTEASRQAGTSYAAVARQPPAWLLFVQAHGDENPLGVTDRSRLIAHLEREMLAATTVAPQVSRNTMQDQRLRFDCANEETRTWLRGAVGRIEASNERPRGYLGLRPDELTPDPQFLAWLPAGRDADTTVRLLVRCNPGVAEGTIRVSRTGPSRTTPGTMYLVFSARGPTAAALQAADFRPWCGCSRLRLRPLGSTPDPIEDEVEEMEQDERTDGGEGKSLSPGQPKKK
jgi:hypothetical protein